jgi:arabinogalactan endo-1,4-beta-galactosidase
VRKLGFKFLLNYHYSDTWADPGKQFMPKAWKDKSHAELVTAVEEYTKETIAAFREADVMPDMVQVGNEIADAPTAGSPPTGIPAACCRRAWASKRRRHQRASPHRFT